MIAAALLESVRLLATSTWVLADRTVVGITANAARARALAESSPAVVTPLNRIVGYENAAKIAKHAVATGVTVRQAVHDLGFVARDEITSAQLDDALDVLAMTRPPTA